MMVNQANLSSKTTFLNSNTRLPSDLARTRSRSVTETGMRVSGARTSFESPATSAATSTATSTATFTATSRPESADRFSVEAPDVVRIKQQLRNIKAAIYCMEEYIDDNELNLELAQIELRRTQRLFFQYQGFESCELETQLDVDLSDVQFIQDSIHTSQSALGGLRRREQALMDELSLRTQNDANATFEDRLCDLGSEQQAESLALSQAITYQPRFSHDPHSLFAKASAPALPSTPAEAQRADLLRDPNRQRSQSASF